MAKRKKPVGKPASTPRRTTRRTKQGENDVPSTSAAAEGDPSVEPSTSGTTNSQDFTQPATSTESSALIDLSGTTTVKTSHTPVVALHKKFGKYRLFNNEESFVRKYEVGSDSETNSSVEIRVVDLCASSESDSNALDTQSDTNSGVCCSPMNSSVNASQSHDSSRDISPVPMVNDTLEIQKLPKDKVHQIEKMESEAASTLVPVPPDLGEKSFMEQLNIDTGISSDVCSNQANPLAQNIPLADEQIEQVEFAGDDDEVITIVQIVEDDNPELYYNIQIDSPKDQTTLTHNEDKEIYKKHDVDFQTHFENLNLDTSHEQINLQMGCRIPQCDTPDLQFLKEGFGEPLLRPDPSLTPSSTLSDDSNSSRATEVNQNNSNDSAESSPTGVRRSSRIKTISNMKQKTKGYGLVKTPLKKALIMQTKLKLEEMSSDSQEKSNDISITAPNSPSFPVPSDMPVKVKSRWRRSSELEMGTNSPASSPLASPNLPQRLQPVAESADLQEDEPGVTPLTMEAYDKIIEERMNQYEHLEENEYLCERMISRETKKMTCDCFMTKEELDRGELACGEDCLNRLLMIECNSRCPVGDRCTNRRFQKMQNAPLKVFYADKKGCGVEAGVDIPPGEFLMEYVGEVLDYELFYKRAQAYSDVNNLHHYFMSLKGDTVIDATVKGNISRFINHSCEPNAETQKWTVNGELRIGFFSKRDIVAGEEITFDYQFQRFGKVAQRCYCGANNCRGWIGAEPDSDDEDYEEEEEDVSTSKSGTAQLTEESQVADAHAELPHPQQRKSKRERKYKPKVKDLVQDADIEEDLEALSRTGVKNQSHTLRLSRTVVRAKTRRAQARLLRLLRDADLPCRRLFLDYRGLRLLAPWCTDATLNFRLEMLQTVDRLPITNKTMVQESRFFTIVERWLNTTDVPQDQVFIDEATGLPVELPNRDGEEDTAAVADRSREHATMLEKMKDLSSQLLERWSSLKEVFKIPKKERIQQMKEHERQANIERRAADSSGARDRDRDRERRDDRDRREERDRDKERDRERDRDRERERTDRERERGDRDRDRGERDRDRHRERDRDDRDRRKRRGSPDGRRSIRLSERVLAAVPPLSKEERRRAFAEAAAAAEDSRRTRPPPAWPPYWPQHPHPPRDSYAQMFPGGLMGMVPEMTGEWLPEFPPRFCPPPFGGPQSYCMPQHNLMGMSGFGMGRFMFGQQMPAYPHPPPQQHDLSQGLAPMATDGSQCVEAGAGTTGSGAQAEAGEEPVLPSLWRSAVDDRGRRYYYHVKLRQPQWLPPPPSQHPEESSSEEEEEQIPSVEPPIMSRRAKGKVVEGVNGIYEVIKEDSHNGLIPEHALITIKPRKRRPGLVSERPISPRTEEDKLAGRLEVKRYKQTKEKLRRRRERLMQKVRLLATAKRGKELSLPELKMVDLADSDTDSDLLSDEEDKPAEEPVEEAVVVAEESPSPSPSPAEAEEMARRRKEQFRSSMARVMVQHLNPYRRSDAPLGRITCTADFKHLARKLTHFVMLKELKHCQSVEELVVTDSVRTKAKTFVKKYMAKFGPVYKRPPEEAD